MLSINLCRVSQRYILVRSITDDGTMLAMSCNECTDAADVIGKVSSFIGGTGYKILLVSNNGIVNNGTSISRIHDVIYYAVILQYGLFLFNCHDFV